MTEKEGLSRAEKDFFSALNGDKEALRRLSENNLIFEFPKKKMMDEEEFYFCPVCCCEMDFLVSEAGDGYYQCHCGYKEEV